ncbi:recombinase family protein [Bacillus paramycoides]|uniref:recombinase family protein n=1 Tax=Bacillus paramycoides TaxID=2026194 RepID=UPI003D0289E2
MNNEKYHVFFRRASTAGQDLAMQSSADAPYREKLLRDEIVIVDEYAISANKLSVHDRPEMQKVISLIKQGKVHTLYAFDRTRLFRDSYEAQEYHDLRTKHDIQLVYTSVGNGHIQATEDVFLEGLLNIFSDIEGKNIARRTLEARRRYPPQKLGYEKVKETKQYWQDSTKKDLLNQFFSALLETSTIDELANLLNRYRKKAKGCP